MWAVVAAAWLGIAAGAAGEETFEYRVDWRFWHAGDIELRYAEGEAAATLKTRGFVDALYHVDNRYRVEFGEGWCAQSARFDVREGSKRREIRIEYQSPPGRVRYVERDLVRERIVLRKSLPVPACVHDELTALARFRRMGLEPGAEVWLPVSNGKRAARVRVRALAREEVRTPAGVFHAVRYEAFLFNNVLYRRRGRLFFWLTDDGRRLPVQFQVRLRFYYGTITLRLVRYESR